MVIDFKNYATFVLASIVKNVSQENSSSAKYVLTFSFDGHSSWSILSIFVWF
jgi:hypothetical protein